MTKMTTPGEVAPTKPMTSAEREARKAFRHVDPRTAVNFGLHPAEQVFGGGGGDSGPLALAGHTLMAIVNHKRFHVQMASDQIDAHGLHYLLAAIQQNWKLKMTIELARFDSKIGKRAAHTVVGQEFVAQAISSLMLAQDAFAFNFNILGGVRETDYDD